MRYERHIDLALVGPIAARTAQYRRRKARAQAYIADALSRCRKPYLSLSGGKDSVAMLALVADVAKLTAWAHVSDASFPGTVETCRAACDQVGVQLVIDESPVSAWDVIGKQSRQKFGKEGWFFSRIGRWLDVSGCDLAFVGVRAAESKRRRDACVAHGHLFRTDIPHPHWKCHPLQWFSIEDVAAVIHEYGMPIHPIYKKTPVDDLPIRLGYATSLDLLDRGTVVFMRRNYPALYHRLVTVYPDARAMQ